MIWFNRHDLCKITSADGIVYHIIMLQNKILQHIVLVRDFFLFRHRSFVRPRFFVRRRTKGHHQLIHQGNRLAGSHDIPRIALCPMRSAKNLSTFQCWLAANAFGCCGLCVTSSVYNLHKLPYNHNNLHNKERQF